MTNANLTNANLTNLSNANLTDSRIIGVIWDNTTSSDGMDSDINGGTRQGHL